ncbi:hypothetical protein [Thermococcus peptonophilus]|uniref:hypothetical protein n=1 Tax=Thermococcus peptonophilus TaxID=53952 RepID=UPI000A51E00B
MAWYVDSRSRASDRYTRLREILRKMSRGEDVYIPPPSWPTLKSISSNLNPTLEAIHTS